MDTLHRDVAGHVLSNPCKKKGASVMVASGMCVGRDGVGHVFPPFFIPLGTKIKGARYQDVLRSYYDPLAKTFCGAEEVFQKDGVPSHTARSVRCSVKRWRGLLPRPICLHTTTTFLEGDTACCQSHWFPDQAHEPILLGSASASVLPTVATSLLPSP